MTISEEMVERAARAIATDGFGRPWDDFLELNAFDTDQSDLLEYARAALIAALQGSVVVPAEPTEGHLRMFGYAPGNYQNRCFSCEQIHEGVDKRASSCRDCALSRWARFVGECASVPRHERDDTTSAVPK